MYPMEFTADRKLDLKDGTSVSVRPIEPSDAERFYWFLGGITDEDRKYLRVDVRNRNLVMERVRNPDPERCFRLVAEDEREIVAEAALETYGPGWEEDVGEMRLLVAPHYRGRGLGRLLAREIYLQGFRLRLKRLVARAMRPQLGARRILKRLGFVQEAMLPDHVKDTEGHRQDLIIMGLDLENMRAEMRSGSETSDFRRHR